MFNLIHPEKTLITLLNVCFTHDPPLAEANPVHSPSELINPLHLEYVVIAMHNSYLPIVKYSYLPLDHHNRITQELVLLFYRNSLCGRLQCDTGNLPLLHYDSIFIIPGCTTLPTGPVCCPVIIDVGQQVTDPGLVPDGAPCGSQKVTKYQKIGFVGLFSHFSSRENTIKIFHTVA